MALVWSDTVAGEGAHKTFRSICTEDDYDEVAQIVIPARRGGGDGAAGTKSVIKRLPDTESHAAR